MLEGDEELMRQVCDRCFQRSGGRPSPAPAPASSAPAPAAPAAAQVSHKVLIIDDEPLLLKLLSKRLESAGYKVVIAGDGAEGYEKIKSEKPDLVLSDLLMPQLTGYDLIKKIRKETDGSQFTPVLIMTAKGSMKEFFEGWEIDDFITKPIDPEKLLSRIRELIHTADLLRKKKGGK